MLQCNVEFRRSQCNIAETPGLSYTFEFVSDYFDYIMASRRGEFLPRIDAWNPSSQIWNPPAIFLSLFSIIGQMNLYFPLDHLFSSIPGQFIPMFYSYQRPNLPWCFLI